MADRIIKRDELRSLREEISAFLQFQVPDRVPDMRVIARAREESFSRLLVEYEALDGETISAFLLIPNSSRAAPGCVILHQHASQWHLGKSEVCGLAGDPWQAFGPALARAGICVLAPDAVGFESRAKSATAGVDLAAPTAGANEPDWLHYYNAMCYRLVQGQTLMRKILEDTAVAINVLSTNKAVDHDRVGVAGHSFGGNISLFIGALDERLQFVCASGAACTYRQKIQEGTGIEMAEVIPGFASRYDIDDLVKCIAPRRALLVSSTEDPFARDAAEIVDSAYTVYERMGCREHLKHFRSEGPHSLDKQRFETIIQWLVIEAQNPSLVQ